MEIKQTFYFAIDNFNIFVTFKYHERFNDNRKFMDFRNIDKANFIDASIITDNSKG